MNGDFGTSPLKKGQMARPAYPSLPPGGKPKGVLSTYGGWAAALLSAPHGHAQGEECDVSNG